MGRPWGRGSDIHGSRGGQATSRLRARRDERSGHQEADLLGVGVARRPGIGEAALRDHREPVADLEQFVLPLLHHLHRDAGGAQGDQRLAELRRGTDVNAPGRLRGDHQLRRLPDLAPDDELLQIAAGE